MSTYRVFGSVYDGSASVAAVEHGGWATRAEAEAAVLALYDQAIHDCEEHLDTHEKQAAFYRRRLAGLAKSRATAAKEAP